MSEETCLVYKCPKCTDHTLVDRPCWFCKIPMQQVSIPSKGRRLVESFDMINAKIMEMKSLQDFVRNTEQDNIIFGTYDK